MTACAECLRRTALVGFLSPQVATRLGAPRRSRAILALSDQDLIDEVGGMMTPDARKLVSRFDAGAARQHASDAGLHAICRHEELYPRRLRDHDQHPRRTARDAHWPRRRRYLTMPDRMHQPAPIVPRSVPVIFDRPMRGW